MHTYCKVTYTYILVIRSKSRLLIIDRALHAWVAITPRKGTGNGECEQIQDYTKLLITKNVTCCEGKEKGLKLGKILLFVDVIKNIHETASSTSLPVIFSSPFCCRRTHAKTLISDRPLGIHIFYTSGELQGHVTKNQFKKIPGPIMFDRFFNNGNGEEDMQKQHKNK